MIDGTLTRPVPVIVVVVIIVVARAVRSGRGDDDDGGDDGWMSRRRRRDVEDVRSVDAGAGIDASMRIKRLTRGALLTRIASTRAG